MGDLVNKPKSDAEFRQLPYDVEIEQACLGALLVDNRYFDRIASLKPEHFYDPLHQRMYAAMLSMWGKGGAVTPLILKSALEGDPGIEIVGVQYINTIMFAAPLMPNMADYAAILQNLALRRELVSIGEDLVAAAVSPLDWSEDGYRDDGVNIARYTADQLFLATKQSVGQNSKAASDVAHALMQEYEAALAGNPVPRILTGLSKLDDEIGGLRGKDLITIAGRSGMGKSVLLAGIAVRVALAGYPVLVFSLEMTEAQWVERTLCDLDFDTAQAPHLQYQRFRNGRCSGDEITRAAEASMRLQGLRFHICDDDQLGIDDITAKAKAFAIDAGDLGLVVIDYLQIIRPSSRSRDRNREQEVTALARGCKSLAKQIGWPVMVGCQLLNKGNVDDEERKPAPRDIRESGSVEMESDVILAPWRKAFFVEMRRPSGPPIGAAYDAWKGEHNSCQHMLELIGLKNRHGRRAFNLDMFCEIGASAIRDERPYKGTISQEEAKGLF